VAVDDRLADAGRALAAANARWAVVLDAAGALHGWLGVEQAVGEGMVADRAHRMEAWVPADASLKTAFSTMLQYDAGWVAVLDGDRYLGVLTPGSLHAELRRSVESGESGRPASKLDVANAGEV
jgi:osmoprotectant transport system ATP-binding protein